MSMLPIAMMAGGSAMQGIGSLLGAQSANRAARQARDLSRGDAFSGMGRLYDALGYRPTQYRAVNGGRQIQDEGSATLGPDGRPLPAGETGGGYLGAMKKLAADVSGREAGLTSDFNQGTQYLRTLAGAPMATLRGSEATARSFGAGGEALIDQQTARDSRAAQDQYKASLARSGFGGTFGAGEVAGIGQQFSRAAQQQKLGLRQATTDRVLGVQGQEAGYQNQQTGREYQRAGEGTALQERNLGRDISLTAGPQEQVLQSLSGGVANPFVGMGNPAVNQVSGLGSALSNLGGAAAGYGGYMQGQQNQQQQLLQMLRMMQQQGGGGMMN